MTSNSDSTEPFTMQNAHKESNSGFMLLSVKHLSKEKSDNSIHHYTANGKPNHLLNNCFDGDYVIKTSSCEIKNMGSKLSGLESVRRFSSTASIDAEEYDDEEDTNALTENQSMIIQPNAPVRVQQLQSHSLLGELSNVNTANLNDDVKSATPTGEPSIHPAVYDPSSSINSFQKQRLHEIPSFGSSDPLLDSHGYPVSSAVAAKIFLPNQKGASTTFPHEAIHRIVNRLVGEHMRSASDVESMPSIFTSGVVPVQPASRFRRARIHETVEQWGSSRLTCHDCRLKAVPDWVLYLQTKSPPFPDCSIVNRGLCLYCFVPGYFGSRCSYHMTKQNVSPALPNASQSSEVFNLTQATITAYRAVIQKSFDVASLITTWNAGHRSSNTQLLEHTRISMLKSASNFKTIASEPTLLPEHSRMEIHTSANNATNEKEYFPSSEGEVIDLTDAVVAATCSHNLQQTATEQPFTNTVSPFCLNREDTEASPILPVGDPSAAYLRRQLAHNIYERSPLAPEIFANGQLSQCPQKNADIDMNIKYVPPANPGAISRTIETKDVSGQPEKDFTNVQLLRVSSIEAPALPSETIATSSPHPSDPSLFGSVYPPISRLSIPEVHPLTTTRPLNVPPFLCDSESTASVSRGVFSSVSAVHVSSPCPAKPVLGNVGFQTSLAAQLTPSVVDHLTNHTVLHGPMTADNHSRTSSVSSSTSSPKSTAGLTSTIAMPANLEAQMPKCMDVIRQAIMETIQSLLSHLTSENEALRATVSSLQHENRLLRNYKRAFSDLRSYFQPEIWERLEAQAQQVDPVLPERAANHFFPPSPLQGVSAFQAPQTNSFPNPRTYQFPTQHLSTDPPQIQPPTSTGATFSTHGTAALHKHK